MNDLGLFRVAAAVPQVVIGNPAENVKGITSMAHKAASKGARMVVFPELCITGYTCADLFGQSLLLRSAEQGLKTLLDDTADIDTLIVVGMPIAAKSGALYNCAVACCGGKICAVVPKMMIPNYGEFYERRWFESWRQKGNTEVDLCGQTVPFGTDIAVSHDGVMIGFEICEDLWAPEPPSAALCSKGVTVVANLSASNEVVGKHDYLVSLIGGQSARCRCVYVYASAGVGESSTDLVFAGNAIIAEDGKLLAESPRFTGDVMLSIADVDIDALLADRRRTNLYQQGEPAVVVVTGSATESASRRPFLRRIDPYPFVPAEGYRRDSRCREVIAIQTEGLCQRLRSSGIKRLVVGVSGGLDSTLALLVAARAFDKLGYPREDIHAITMPGFGTTGRTYTNAVEMMRLLGVTTREIPIANAVMQHFSDIGQDPDNHDTTYENSQARERTQILMDYSGRIGGMVLGTGDLSELALGWCTYNGDHMSMYGVNSSVPKTLVKYLVKWIALSEEGKLKEVLLDVVDTPISPELIPADENDNITQKTEDLVGPYELHDFFLYNMLRRGYRPIKIFEYARQAFHGTFDDATILKWLRTFYRRFFTQQFKRSCMPDGPKTGSICLSPRGDWRMPSDASAALWLAETDSIQI